MKGILIGILSLFTIIGYTQESIQWNNIENVLNENSSSKKKLIYIHTDWCTMCKLLKKGAFKYDKAIEEITKNYIAIEFNAEQKDSIEFKGKKYGHRPTRRKGGFHQLADVLAGNELWGYPTLVIYDEEWNQLTPMKNYLKKNDFLEFLKYFSSNAYKTKTFNEYLEKS